MIPHLDHDDVVPAFRTNLAFSRPPAGLGTAPITVKDVVSGDEFHLRGFEYSLARMLDGKRTAHEVLEAAAALGIPLTLLDLNGFVRRLDEHHLIAEPGTGAEDDVIARPWNQRSAWAPETRTLYRQALREGRAGNLNRAMLSLDCLLAEHANVPEAVTLLDRLEQRAAGTQFRPFSHVFAEAERDWQDDVVTEKVHMPDEKKKWLGIAGAVAVIAIALGILFIPWPHTITKAATLAPIVTGKIRAPRTGTVASIDVRQGQWVDEGTVLFTFDVKEELTQLEAAVARLNRLSAAQYERLPATPEVTAARERLKKAELSLSIAEKNPTDPSLNVALQELANARADLDVFVPEDQMAELETQRAEVQSLEMAVLEAEVKAPVSGAVTTIAASVGDEITRGSEAVRLDDTRQLKAVAKVEGRDRAGLKEGQTVLVVSRGRATQAEVYRADDGVVEVLIDNPQRIFAPGTAQLQIRTNPTPLVRPVSTY